jgi:hypothetical protein
MRIKKTGLTILFFIMIVLRCGVSCGIDADDLFEMIESGEPVEGSGSIITGNLYIGYANLPDSIMVNRNQYASHKCGPNVKVVKSRINLSDAVFQGSVDFHNVNFQNEVDFSHVTFKGDAIFPCCVFNKSPNFYGAKFSKLAFFSGSEFQKKAYFNNSQFNQSARFEWVQFMEPSIFKDVEFNDRVDFTDAHFIDTTFENTLFNGASLFNNVRINGSLSLYMARYNNLNIRWPNILKGLVFDDTSYYLLIENYKKLGFTDDAKDCYYDYRYEHMWELLRKEKYNDWIFDFLAWITYGYGLRPVWPLRWSALFILLGGGFFFITQSITRSKGPDPPRNRMPAIRRKIRMNEQLQRSEKISIWEAILLSATYFTSGASSIISSVPEEFRPLGRSRYVVVILRLLGWIFFVLFLTSLGKIA